jgi:hypothetical protein
MLQVIIKEEDKAIFARERYDHNIHQCVSANGRTAFEVKRSFQSADMFHFGYLQ